MQGIASSALALEYGIQDLKVVGTWGLDKGWDFTWGLFLCFA